MQEVAEEAAQASLGVSVGELKMVKGADSLTEEVALRRKGQAGVGQVEGSGKVKAVLAEGAVCRKLGGGKESCVEGSPVQLRPR